MEELFYKIFSDLPRQGPGNKESTLKAIQKLGNLPNEPNILDVGCGTGLQTFELVKYYGSKIVAVDNHKPYLDTLYSEAKRKGFDEHILCLNANMLDPDFVKEKYNLIWAEGSIYIIGFEKGLSVFKELLEENGLIAVTEVNWIKDNPPAELKKFWEQEYPAINTIKKNLSIIINLNFKLIDHFTLPESAWWDDYYTPLEQRLKNFRIEYHEDEDALEMIDFVQLEIDMYRKYSAYYGYVFYIMQKK